jgi:hypothetical protein|uniref:Uncharacterized protein n=2 Tax=Ostreococcus mediterraneus TaxID=1486918 RepID=A0A6U0EFM5_9CHLO|mmetsp:Transcript_6121/g.22088  ORF Transcript_6121/g.22088 Transcript_6121/m.22088 type:complete len:219 (+) Transcript_6121:40-696(+)
MQESRASSSASTPSSTSAVARVELPLNDRLRALLELALTSNALKDTSTVARAKEALRTNAVPHAVAFDACQALRDSNVKRDAYVRQALLMSPTKARLVVDRGERPLTAEEERARDEHRELMRKIKSELAEREYRDMVRGVDPSYGEDDGKFSVDARAYGFGVHVLSLMFALVCAGYFVGKALENRYGGTWARGLCAALGAALALCVETGLFILRDARV